MKTIPLSKKEEIEALRVEYRMTVVKALSDKPNYFSWMKQANSILSKIFTIQKKAELKARYGKENGFNDEFSGKIIE